MCAEQGGEATALARSLYVREMGPVVFDEDSLCTTGSSKKEQEQLQYSKQKLPQPAFNIYPNPSSGKVYISCTVPMDGSCKVVLINAIGQETMFHNRNMNAGIIEIDAKGLSSGLYTVRLLKDGRQLYTGKLSLIK
jgi:hypothetical protein